MDELSERSPIRTVVPGVPAGVWRGPASLIPGLLILLALAVVPLAVRNRYVLSVFIQANLYAAMAASWDVLSGYTGRENFGHALFIGTGAYAAALLNTRLHIPPLLGIAAAGGMALLFAVLVGIPTLRLRGPYFALATLAAAGIMERLALLLWPFTGGEDGVYGVQALSLSADLTYYASLVFTGAVVLALYGATRSPWGIVLRAIQANETACEAAGLNTTAYKISALLVSALPAGLAGGLYAHVQEHVGPAVYSPALSVTVIIMAFIGGIGTIYGAAVGGFLLTVLGESLRGFGEYRLLLYSAVLLPVIVYMPRGIVVHFLGVLKERYRWRS